MNAKAGSQEIPGVTGKFGFRVQNEGRQSLTEFVKRKHWSQQMPFSNARDNFTHGHHQMVNTTSRLIIIFVAEDGEALYSQ